MYMCTSVGILTMYLKATSQEFESLPLLSSSFLRQGLLWSWLFQRGWLGGLQAHGIYLSLLARVSVTDEPRI